MCPGRHSITVVLRAVHLLGTNHVKQVAALDLLTTVSVGAIRNNVVAATIDSTTAKSSGKERFSKACQIF